MQAYKNKKGGALIVVTIIVFIIISFTFSLLNILKYDIKVNSSTLDLMTAKYTAQGALSATVIALNKSTDIVEIQGNGAYWDSIIVKFSDGTWKQLSNDLNNITSSHAWKVYNNRNNPLEKRPAMDFRVKISEYNEEGFIAKVSTICKDIKYGLKGYILLKNRLKPESYIFGDKIVALKGNAIVDSYDSQKGEYGNDNIGEEALVGCNGNIYVDGSAKIYGSAYPGPGCDVNNPDKVTGEIVSNKKYIKLEEIDKSWLNNKAYKFPKNNIVYLSTGEYHYTNITLQEYKKLVIDGDVKLYCHGDFKCMSHSLIEIKDNGKLTLYVSGKVKFSGKFKGINKKPIDFQIKSVYNNIDEVNNLPDPKEKEKWGVYIRGNSILSAVIYAPKTYVIVTGHCDFFGAISAYGLLITGSKSNHPGNGVPNPHNAKFHYDISLKNIHNNNEIYYYIEKTFPSTFENYLRRRDE